MPFPRSSKYDPNWIKQNALGENVLYMTEGLTDVMILQPGMRVLDLGCGNAISSIFLAKEFGVFVWAIDDKVPARENLRRIEEAGVADFVMPLQLAARNLPTSEEYFDAVIAVQSYLYYGATDDYLSYILQYIKPRGYIGIADACFTREILSMNDAPEFIQRDYVTLWSKMHSLDWWIALWTKESRIEVVKGEPFPETDIIFKEYIKDHRDDESERLVLQALRADKEKLFSLFRLVGRKR
jgi:cyclopropane fatty-acyl-phospholipid synthase-like methyltransferase